MAESNLDDFREQIRLEISKAPKTTDLKVGDRVCLFSGAKIGCNNWPAPLRLMGKYLIVSDVYAPGECVRLDGWSVAFEGDPYWYKEEYVDRIGKPFLIEDLPRCDCDSKQLLHKGCTCGGK